MAVTMRKRVSILVPFEVMRDNIKFKERWVRSDWKDKNRYVTLADERYCTPCLIMVYKERDDYVIFKPTYNDYKYRWKRIDGGN